MQIKEILKKAKTGLKVRQTVFEAESLLAFFLGKDRNYIVLNPDEDYKYLDGFWDLINERNNGKPFEYIIGEAHFFGRKFTVNENVLIPRPETEILVNEALKFEGKILDMGTGSGCIAISLDLRGREMAACDISPKALQIAQKNADDLGAEVEFFRSDLWQNVQEKYPIVVANLPYVPLGQAQKSVADYEPDLAVFSGIDGLDLYRRFFTEMKYLPEVILLEMHFSQASAIIEIAQTKNPNWKAKIIQDEAGFDRVIILQ